MLHIILYEPEIPHNTGAIGRLCVSKGARLHLIQPLGFSLDEKSVRRSGLDYWNSVDLHLWDDWDHFIGEHPELDLYYFTTKTNQSYWDVDYPKECGLVFGPETRGLPESLLEKEASRGVQIPMEEGPIRSLNLATAVGIGMFEVFRQQR